MCSLYSIRSPWQEAAPGDIFASQVCLQRGRIAWRNFEQRGGQEVQSCTLALLRRKVQKKGCVLREGCLHLYWRITDSFWSLDDSAVEALYDNQAQQTIKAPWSFHLYVSTAEIGIYHFKLPRAFLEFLALLKCLVSNALRKQDLSSKLNLASVLLTKSLYFRYLVLQIR